MLSASPVRLTVFSSEGDHWLHKPLHAEIVRFTHFTGASVIGGVEGCGATSRIRDFLPQPDDLVTERLVIMDSAEVVRYLGHDHQSRQDQ